ncbi:MAG: hypothetical protein RL272_1058 [Candidatus Parcubacteria bacterium]|jgi:1-acyl-sn-glycerol-3-phosphate acyltransferase
MALTRYVRASIALLALAVPFIFVAAPALYAIVLWDRAAGTEGLKHRRRVAAWQAACGEAALFLVKGIMGIAVTYDLPPDPLAAGPYIVISNHFGGFDGFLIVRALRSLFGRADIRAIGKREVRKWPVVGRAWSELRWGFVARNHDPDDHRAVGRCGESAAADAACALIFPEGTVFDPDKRRDGFTRVLPPKSGGLKTLRRAMPGAPVLCVTLVWASERYGGSLLDGTIPFGASVCVVVRLADVPDDVEGWLLEEWRRKDAMISAGN